MAAYKARDKAFTIVELLTVVTILSLLVAMLTPYLSKAREITKRALCLSNQRVLAEAGLGFAASHNGRGPGGGYYGYPGDPKSSISWADMLNTEWLRADTNYGRNGGTIQRMGCAPVKGAIYCPCIRYTPACGLYPRGHQWNMYALGGANWGGNPDQGPYGMVEDANLFRGLYGDGGSNGPLQNLSLGAQFSRFRRPDYQILVTESEYGNDSCASIWGGGNSVLLGVDDPPWTALGHQYSFRHVLPPDPALYQEQATACYAFIDGHVDIVRPSMDINADARYTIEP